MRRIFLCLIIAFTFPSFTYGQIFKSRKKTIHRTWLWKESIHVDNYSNATSPKIIRSTRKIVFTKDGKIITYRNNVEVRICKYKLDKGISLFDNLEHDFIIFEGITYIIEKLDGRNLILANNNMNGYRSVFKR